MSDYDENPDWQNFLCEIASEVDALLTIPDHRERFGQQMQTTIAEYD